MKIFLAKGMVMYYLKHCKESHISKFFLRTLLFFALFSIAFHPNAFAGLKEKSAEEYRLEGYEAQEKGRLEEALTFYTKAASLSSPGRRAPILNDIGVIYEELGVPDRAEENYRQALIFDSRYLPACTNLAYLYKKQGNWEKAARYFQRRIEWGHSEDPWTGRAKRELSLLGEKDPRVKKWLASQKTAKLTENANQKSHEEFSESIIQARRCYDLGQALTKQKKYDQALEQYAQALTLTPGNPKVLRARNEARIGMIRQHAKESADAALSMLELGDTVSAKVEFRKILTLIPDEPLITK